MLGTACARNFVASCRLVDCGRTASDSETYILEHSMVTGTYTFPTETYPSARMQRRAAGRTRDWIAARSSLNINHGRQKRSVELTASQGIYRTSQPSRAGGGQKIMAFTFLNFALGVAVVLPTLFRSGSCDYCADSLSVSTCPDLSTYDQIDLSAYGGKWYEIGSSASFKNLMEAGGVCAEAQYTSESSSSLKVVNSDFLVATPMAMTAAGGISGSSSLICQQARTICSQLSASDSLLNGGLSKVWKFQSDISNSYPTEAGLVSTAASKIQQASKDLGPQLDQLSKYVNQTQTQNSQLSQTDGDAYTVVGLVKSTLSLASSQVTTLDSTYQTITDAQMDLINVAKNLFQQGGDAVGQSLTLTDAATEILAGAKIIQAQVAAMSTALAASTKAATAVLKDTEKPFYNVSTISGTATVNGSDAAKLSVTFNPVPGKLFPTPYWILAVDGVSSSGYNAALVYSCSNVLTGGVEQTLWILGRSSSLSQDVINDFLNLATSLGIKQSCDSPFVYTVRSDKCPF